MRAIKFRAKIKDGDEWKYGGGVQLIGSYALMLSDDGGRGIVHLVQPDTVGQFTGLHDKNGKEIYEGDIVQYPSRLYGFIEAPIHFMEHSWLCGSVQLWEIEDREINVIGNIYETPELLK